tara:strand:- start:17293 stop:17514 length:222 start_codon:yes stop_codon:yes gene_type:complete
MTKKREEATLVGYKILFDVKGNLVTERTAVDIKKLEKFFSKEDYSLVKSIISETKIELDRIHNRIEAALDARK